MTLRKNSPRAKRRWIGLGIATTALMLLVAGAVLAVHDLNFQLDGDVLASTQTNVGNDATPQLLDWDSLFTAAGTEKALPTDFTASAFKRDFNTTTKRGVTVFDPADDSIFSTGSKDTLDINPGWQCKSANNVLTKNDIMNAYVAAYTNPVADTNGKHHQILYFGMERNGNNGDANVAFWFLQGTATCDVADGDWQGHHLDGDVLVVSAFTNGGGVSGIDAYRWSDADGLGGVDGFLDPNSVGHGVDCTATAGGDSLCATTNGGDTTKGGLNATITTPWLTADGTTVDHSLSPSEFFEGGIDLTAENLGDKCFNTFVGDTRSSQSLTATIFDYATDTLGECTSTTTTSPVDATDTSQPPATRIPGDPLDAVVTVKDKTIIDVTGLDTFSGSISWHICGPTVSTSTALCTSGGVDLGSQNITVDGTYYSPTATLTAAGRYCFRAEFSGDTDAGVPGSSDSSATECFTILPRQPTLTTQATTGPVDFGQPISDTVTLANTAHKPGTGGPVGDDGSINPTTLGGDATGAITVVAYGPDSCTTVAFTSGAITAAGNGSYGGTGTAFEFTPSAPGQYVFVAAYAGDLPNTLAILAAACADAPATEKVTVRTIPTQIATTPSYFPQDSATITSSVAGNNLAANGTVTFSLYGATAGPVTALANCQAAGSTGRVYGPVSILTGAAAHSVTVTTNNQTTRISTSGTYYWLVTYAPPAGDTAHTGSQSFCVENINATLTGDAGPGTIFPTP
jgi:hypothetical protein